VDGLLAATARVHDLTLVTGNVKDAKLHILAISCKNRRDEFLDTAVHEAEKNDQLAVQR
jgi:hypothetical protein